MVLRASFISSLVFRSDLANLEKDLVKAPEPIRSATGHAVHMVSIPQHTSQEVGINFI